MKLAVISCIHGNLAALEAVLADIEQQRVEAIYCLGDLVGYGPYPNEVVEIIRALDIPTCQGCWDEDVVEGLNACECSYPSLLAEKRGRFAHEWTQQEITPATHDFLAQLPPSLQLDRLGFVHGSPNSQHEYLLPDMEAFAALERVISSGAETLFCGHTHVPYVRTLAAGQVQVRLQAPGNSGSQAFPTPLRRLINAGSVGEPRHGRPQATYVLYDQDTEQANLREVPYDVLKTCAAIVAKGLPEVFAWRLANGLEYAERAEDPSHVCER